MWKIIAQKVVLGSAVFAMWGILLSMSGKFYADDEVVVAIPFTIITIYLWHKINYKFFD